MPTNRRVGRPRKHDTITLFELHRRGTEQGKTGREIADEGYATAHYECVGDGHRLVVESFRGKTLGRRIRKARENVRGSIPEQVLSGEILFNGRPLPLPFAAEVVMRGTAGRSREA